MAHGEGEFDVDPLPALPIAGSDTDDGHPRVRSAGSSGKARGEHTDDGAAGSAGFRAGGGGVDSGASDQTGSAGFGAVDGFRSGGDALRNRSFSIPPPVPLVGVAAPRGRPLIGLPGSKTSVTTQNTPLGHPMGVSVRNASHEKIAVDSRALKVRMRLAAHDEGLRRVAPECVTAMAHAVCAYVQRVARAAVAARDARIAERGGVGARGLGRGGGAGEPGTGDGDVDEGSDCELATLEARMLGTDRGGPGGTRVEPTVRIEDLLAAMRRDPDPAAAAHLERVGLSLAEDNAREVALGGFGDAFD